MDYCLKAGGLFKFRDKIYVPDDNELKKLILREFHAKLYSGHLGYQKTLTIVNKFYYWLDLKKEVAEFVARCLDCQQVKEECKHLGGLLQSIPIPEWKWEVISMDFIIGLQRIVRQHDSITVVVDSLTKVVHFLPVKSTYLANDVEHVFNRNIMRLNGVFNRDTSRFLKELFIGLDIEFAFNTSCHPQKDG